MEAGIVLWLFAAAFGASALGGVLGMASGIFIVPILTLFFGVDIQVAIGASLVSVIACSCGSAATFLRGRLTNIRLAVVLETATTLGALTGVFLIGIASAVIAVGIVLGIIEQFWGFPAPIIKGRVVVAAGVALFILLPIARPTEIRSCCRYCSTGKPCGNSCINRSYTCRQPVECAC